MSLSLMSLTKPRTSMLTSSWLLPEHSPPQEKVFWPLTSQLVPLVTDSHKSTSKTPTKTELLSEISFSKLLDSLNTSQEPSCMTRPLETLDWTELSSSMASLPRALFPESRSMPVLPPLKEPMTRLPLWVSTVCPLEPESTTEWESDSLSGEPLSRLTKQTAAHLNKPLKRPLTLSQDMDPSANTPVSSQLLSQRSSKTEPTLSKNALRFPRKFTKLCNKPSSNINLSKRDFSGSQT